MDWGLWIGGRGLGVVDCLEGDGTRASDETERAPIDAQCEEAPRTKEWAWRDKREKEVSQKEVSQKEVSQKEVSQKEVSQMGLTKWAKWGDFSVYFKWGRQ